VQNIDAIAGNKSANKSDVGTTDDLSAHDQIITAQSQQLMPRSLTEQADQRMHAWTNPKSGIKEEARSYLREGLVSVCVERRDLSDALEHAGSLLPHGRQLLAVPAPRREELDQHHPICFKHLHQKKKRVKPLIEKWRSRSGGGAGDRGLRGRGRASETLDLKLLGLSWTTGLPAE
jgi:hypothetical protein